MLNKIGIYTTLTSFLIGTLLLLFFYFTNSNEIAGFGIYFIIVAGIINLIIIALLLAEILTDKDNRKRNLKTSRIMLLNIPVLVLYFYFVMFLLSIMRITFINDTGKIITDLKIIGGEPKTIEKLEKGESQTEWIKIISENDLVLEYKIDREIKTEMIYSYMISGEIFKYKIGNKSNQIN
ncbi:MAG: hypothetical protein ACOH1N_00845 [Lutibacter sp.]